MNFLDYITYHGNVTNIRDNVDENYIWFDICQNEIYMKDGRSKNNPSFFSARMYKSYLKKINLKINMFVYVKGIPKGYVDKNGHRQNYIHVIEINGSSVSDLLSSKYRKDDFGNEYWGDTLITSTEDDSEENKELLKEIQELLGRF